MLFGDSAGGWLTRATHSLPFALYVCLDVCVMTYTHPHTHTHTHSHSRTHTLTLMHTLHIRSVLREDLEEARQTIIEKSQETGQLQTRLQYVLKYRTNIQDKLFSPSSLLPSELKRQVEELTQSKHALEGEVRERKGAMDSLCSEHQHTVEALTSKCRGYEEKFGKSGHVGGEGGSKSDVFFVHAAEQEAVILRSKEELESRMCQVESEHQERLESLTNKCLVFEEELSESKKWLCEVKSCLVSGTHSTSQGREAGE